MTYYVIEILATGETWECDSFPEAARKLESIARRRRLTLWCGMPARHYWTDESDIGDASKAYARIVEREWM